MSFCKPPLALIGHGTTGKDKTGKGDIERGIHLRWQFRREMGFPLGCFRLYRRPSGEYGKIVCLDFMKLKVSEKRKPFNLGSKTQSVMISSSRWPLALVSPQISADKLGISLERVLSVPDAELEIKLSERAYLVKVRAIFKSKGRITLVAYAEGLEVGRSAISVPSAGVKWVTVRASAIDKVVLQAESVDLVQVCYIPCEECRDHEKGNWQQLEEPICLPIHYPDKPSKDTGRKPECEWLNVEDRLPKDPCARARYGGDRAKELVSVLRTLIDPESITAQADQLIEATALPDDCPPPGQESPEIYFPAIDAILMAAIDPIVAKIVGLYYIDKGVDEGKDYDYKIEGYWPYNTLWQLSEFLTFDDYLLHKRFLLNIFTIDRLTFRSSTRPTIIDEPSKWARTEKALAFFKADDQEWNFPSIPGLPFSIPEDTVEIRFPQGVGEVQIHLGQQVPNVTMEAWDDERNRRVDVLEGTITDVGQVSDDNISVNVNIKDLDAAPKNMLKRKLLVQNGKSFRILSNSMGSPVPYGFNIALVLHLDHPVLASHLEVGDCSIEPHGSTRRKDVLAVHGYRSTDQITRIVLKGKDFWLYKISWQEERIPHGIHCAFVYGLRIEDPEPLKAPSNVKAIALPGLVKKVADCTPLLEGEMLDARYSIGLYWDLPIVNGQLLPKAPIRYHIMRTNQNDEEVLLTENNPTIVTPVSPEIKETRIKNLPAGWPENPPQYIDSGLEPGIYQYRVAGIDLFGRISPFSRTSNPVKPEPPPPPPPANMSAHFIDRKDPWLSSEDQNALPADIDEAIRLRWIWSEHLDRMSPDVQSFKIHYMPCMPNVLIGQVLNIDNETNTIVQVTAQIEGLKSAPKDLLAGRLLFQSGKAFRILTHSKGTGAGSKQKMCVDLRLPPTPSKNRPTLGFCSVTLDAVIPVDVAGLSYTNGEITAMITTTALKAVPSSGLKNGVLTAAGIEATISDVNNATLTDSTFEAQVKLTLSDSAKKRRFLDIPAPFFAKLSLPPPNTDAFKDCSISDSWPTDFTATIPKAIVGRYDSLLGRYDLCYDLLIRKGRAGETNGLTAINLGKYVLIVDELPQGLTKNEVNFDNPRSEGNFAVSCVGPGGQGPVSFPAKVTRVYRGDKAKQDEVLTSLKPPVCPEDFVLEGPPNFEGKLRYEFSWNKIEGWRYEVFRTLDDTLFKVDASIRDDIATGKIPQRFSDETEKQNWLNNFQLSGAPDLHSVITSLIINPQTIDLTAIESHNYRNILLQALASLPFNDRAFTRLDLDSEHLKADENDSTKMICIDDTIEGKAQGRYFYRVLACDTIGNLSPLGMSTSPVYVRGDQRPAAPTITKIQGGDRQIVIRWARNRESNVKGYLVYRTDDKSRTKDPRRMEIVKHETTDFYSVEVPDPLPEPPPIEFEYIDNNLKPRKPYYYGLVAVSESENQQKFTSKISSIRVAEAYDLTPPDPPIWTRSEWIRVDTDGIEYPFSDPIPAGESRRPAVALAWTSTDPNLKPLIQKRSDDEASFSRASDWLPQGSTEYILQGLHPHIRYHFRLRVLSLAGNCNQDFNIATVEPIVIT